MYPVAGVDKISNFFTTTTIKKNRLIFLKSEKE